MLCHMNSPFARLSEPWHRLTDSEWEPQLSIRNSLRLGFTKRIDITSLSARHLQIALGTRCIEVIPVRLDCSFEANRVVPSLPALGASLPKEHKGFPHYNRRLRRCEPTPGYQNAV